MAYRTTEGVEFRDTPGGGLEVLNHGVWTHVPDYAADHVRKLEDESRAMLVLTDAEWDVLMQAVIHYRALAAEFDNDVAYADLISVEEKLIALRIEHNKKPTAK